MRKVRMLVRRIENIIVDYYDSEDENYNAGECLVKIDFCIMDFENDLRSIKIMTKELTEVGE